MTAGACVVGSAKTLNQISAGNVWGTMVFGNDTFGGGLNEKRIRINLPPNQSRYVQFKLRTNTAGENWKLHKLEVFYNLRGDR